MLIESASACHPFWVGVDVGKESLSVYIAASDKALTIPNKTSAIKDFCANIRRLRSLLSHRRL